jgi:putative YphP/YqiW family bacilliredoxin
MSYYDPEAVRPMWEELAAVGIKPLTTPAEVDTYIKAKPGTTLLFINSVCGCSAGNARPGLMEALQHTVIPDHLVTVFAGVDLEATNRAREFMPGITASSPFVALFKEGQLVMTLPRQEIERMDKDQVADILVRAFDTHCSAPGPSVPPSVYASIRPVKQCGSSIPLMNG